MMGGEHIDIGRSGCIIFMGIGIYFDRYWPINGLYGSEDTVGTRVDQEFGQISPTNRSITIPLAPF